CFGVVGNGTSGIILQPPGLSTVVIWRVIFRIEFGRSVKIRDSTVQIAVFRFFDPAINKVAIGSVRRRRRRWGFRRLFLIGFPGVTDTPVGIAYDPRAHRYSSCGRLLADWNHLDIKRNWFAFGAAQGAHLFQILPGMCTGHDLIEKSQLNQGVMRKFYHAVMIRCRGILEKAAVRVLANLFGLQNFWSYLKPNDSTFPVELMLLDVLKSIRLVIDWCPEWRRRDLFFSRRIIEGAVHDF